MSKPWEVEVGSACGSHEGEAPLKGGCHRCHKGTSADPSQPEVPSGAQCFLCFWEQQPLATHPLTNGRINISMLNKIMMLSESI